MATYKSTKRGPLYLEAGGEPLEYGETVVLESLAGVDATHVAEGRLVLQSGSPAPEAARYGTVRYRVGDSKFVDGGTLEELDVVTSSDLALVEETAQSKVPLDAVGAADGVAELDEDALVPYERMPDAGIRRRTPYLDLHNEGVVMGDNAVDNSAALGAAITKAAAQGYELVWTGTFRIAKGVALTGLAGGRPLRLRGDDPAVSKILVDIPAAEALNTAIDIGGYGSRFATAMTLTADAVQGSNTITVADTATCAVGDSLLLASTAAWPITDKGALRGELVRVASKTTTTITTTTPLDDSYAVASAATARKLHVTTDALIEGFSMIDARPTEGTGALIRLAGVRNFTVRDLIQEGSSGSGMMLTDCEDGTIDNLHFLDFANAPAAGRYGYGVLAHASTRSVEVTRCFMRGGRHLFTTAADSGNSGIPRHIQVSNVSGTAMDNAVVDTHFEGEYIHFRNVRAFNTRAFGAQIRTPNSTITNLLVRGCAGAGLWLRAPGIKARGIDIEDVRNGTFDSEGTGSTTWPGQGIRVGSSVSTHEADDVRLSDVTVKNTDQDSVYVYGQRSRLRGIDLKAPGRVTNGFGVRYALASSTGHIVDGLAVEDATNGIATAASVTGRVRGFRHKNVGSPGTLAADTAWTAATDV